MERSDQVVSVSERSNGPFTGRLSLTVPARPDAVRVVRAVVRSWSSAAGFHLDESDEFCLAVDEAFSGLVSAEPLPSAITVALEADGTQALVTATRDLDTEIWPPVDARSALAQRVLVALIDDVSFERGPDGPCVRLTKRFSDVVERT